MLLLPNSRVISLNSRKAIHNFLISNNGESFSIVEVISYLINISNEYKRFKNEVRCGRAASYSFFSISLRNEISSFLVSFCSSNFQNFQLLFNFLLSMGKKFAVIVAVAICFQFTDKEGRRVLSAHKHGAKPTETPDTAKSQL